MDSIAQQRLVLYTSANNLKGELFRYLYAHVAAVHADVRIVAVQSRGRKTWRTLVRKIKKLTHLKMFSILEITSSLWLQRRIGRRHQEEISRGIAALPRPDIRPNMESVTLVSDVNGPSAVAAMRNIAPAIIIQAGAGILKPEIFSIPRLCTINMHHGIAPLIRGMNSIYWGLWENRHDWIGATIHEIDRGIDTGRPLAYYHIDSIMPGEGFPSLYVRATQGGVQQLVDVVLKLLKGETVAVDCPLGSNEYRSTFSGWKMLLLENRLAKAKI